MLLQGFPLHRLQLGTLSEQDWTHQPIPQPSNSSTQEIGDLGGNSMHLRSMGLCLGYCAQGREKNSVANY